MTSAAGSKAGIMAELKSRTAEAHRVAEQHPLQRQMITGSASREMYAGHLAQMMLVHAALEHALAAALETDARWAGVIDRRSFREALVREDLLALGRDRAAVNPTPGTTAIVEQINRCAEDGDAARLVGMHYVLEGSTNGSKFIARALSKALGIAPGEPGLRYLDPYGAAQQERWGEFKAAMDAVALGEDERERVIAGADEMFLAATAIAEDVCPSA